eukprot:gnl/TRDRNA2_/TRDRNA2_183513_c0_seq1.p1 gnl/TRDRNA2_/TRDRNA2_183513_c0~~gnl/TRDRNA2_/TRDRNA2_183513_c0_seq1.p1  ORF type:complete len:455 (-),score=125.04 gnl/TRDRNA2_/TRDRNA2_183513_c0_seq1:124-1377(-)
MLEDDGVVPGGSDSLPFGGRKEFVVSEQWTKGPSDAAFAEDDNEEEERLQDCEEEEFFEATSEGGATRGALGSGDSGEEATPSAGSSQGGVIDSLPPPTPLDPMPVPARADWDAEMVRLEALPQDKSMPMEEKVNLLSEALQQRVEDTRQLDEHKSLCHLRLTKSTKERDHVRSECARTVATKTKLEGSCRELQQQKSNISAENKRIAEEEQTRHTELKDKFQQAIKDVQEKMDAELEVRQHFLKENEELRGKLQKFTETYEAQEAQLAEQREARGREMEVAQKRLTEHETACSESKIKTAALEKQNEALLKSQQVLRTELQTILSKFDEFHEAVTGSNTRHGECKTEIDTLQKRLQDLETENAELRNNTTLKSTEKEQEVAQKQRDAMERLCDNLAKEKLKLEEKVKALRKRRGNG